MGQPRIGADDPAMGARVKAAYDGDVGDDTGMTARQAWIVMALMLVGAVLAAAVASVAAGFAAHAVVRAARVVWDLVQIGWSIG